MATLQNDDIIQVKYTANGEWYDLCGIQSEDDKRYAIQILKTRRMRDGRTAFASRIVRWVDGQGKQPIAILD